MSQIGNENTLRTCDKSGNYFTEDSNSRICGVCFQMYNCTMPGTAVQWNCERCPNDSEYAQPYVSGETLFMQTHFPMFLNENNNFKQDDAFGCWFVDICDMDGNVIIDHTSTNDYIANTGSGSDNYVDENGVTVFRFAQWFNILTSAINADCFIVRLGRQAPDDVTPVYAWSEPFRRVWCGEDTILIEGNYPYVDNDDNFYSAPSLMWGNAPVFKSQIRIPGTAEIDQYAIEKTSIQSKVVTSKKQAVWLLRSGKVPEYAADIVATILAGQNIIFSQWDYETQIISDTTVEAETSIDKNNEEGSMWLISVRLKEIAKILRTFCSPV